MPAAEPGPRPPPPPARPAPSCPTRPALAHRGLCDHSLKYLSSRITERKLQGSWLPAGRGNLEKPFLGPRGSIMPVFSPQSGLHPVHSENSPLKPRVVTVVKLGGHPLRKITLLLNRRSVQTFEQLLADVSEALGFPRWKNDRVRKLFNLKGREIRSVSDFFREGDAFIATGKEPLTLKNIQVAVEELYPNKARALTLTQHSRVPSPRLRSRLYSKALKGGHHCGDSEIAKSCSEGMGPKAAIRHQSKTRVEPALGERTRTQKWVRGKWEPEPGGKLPKEATIEEKHASGEKHMGVEIEKTSGEIIRCEKCKRELELQQRERLSLGTSELDMGKCQRYEVEKLVRTKSCRRSPEANPSCGEEGWKGDIHRTGPKNSTQELRKPSKNTDKKEDRDQEGQEGYPQAAAKAKKDLVDVQPISEEGPREAKKDTRNAGRNKHGGWLLREQQADAEKRPASGGEEQEPEKEKKPYSSGGKKMIPRDEQAARAEKDSKLRPEESKAGRPSGRKQRPAGIISADVEKHYDTGRVIGDGNFAVVKECRHRETRQAYAMKIIDKSKLKGKEDIVDSEILIIQSLSHPNIVKLHEVYETETEIYLIMEYVQGGDLFDAIIESVKFPERDAALMLMDLCKALVHMHDKSIVHRDLKPENLLVQRNEDKSTTLKLADFGLAKHVVRPIFTVCGTPTYVAPEILSEKGYGLEVDMWAAGVILYILLCGFPPFRSPDRDQDELFNIIQLGHFEFLAPYWDNISDAAKDLVSRLLVVDPKKRYTAHQVLQHPWIETAGKTNTANLPKEVTPSSEGHSRSQHKFCGHAAKKPPDGAVSSIAADLVQGGTAGDCGDSHNLGASSVSVGVSGSGKLAEDAVYALRW
ncbi:Serine/threonine-protein kinase DCLK3 [Galemys pyrenaicus]|uniref:non-specific serine/threonine protein kinase n=1 Tax=Galemys pyrenaicus TaxID=202257 RepID=A0A8J6DUT7_GALPY|nr:Serine/threonine-protein kinase DCLK3 [Galemys pyrenaicus]